MTATLAILLPLLQLVAAPTGAGIAASWLIDRARQRWPLPATPPTAAWRRHGYWLLYAPRATRILAMVLAALIGMLASATVAALTGADVLAAVDLALAGALAALAAQLRHGQTLRSEIPS